MPTITQYGAYLYARFGKKIAFWYKIAKLHKYHQNIWAVSTICKCKQLFWTVRNSFFDKLYLKAITPLEKDSLGVLLATFCVVFKMGTVFDHFAELDLVSVKKTSMILVFFSYPLQRIIFKSFVFYTRVQNVCLGWKTAGNQGNHQNFDPTLLNSQETLTF